MLLIHDLNVKDSNEIIYLWAKLNRILYKLRKGDVILASGY